MLIVVANVPCSAEKASNSAFSFRGENVAFLFEFTREKERRV
jgi:hypothetical protein